MQHIWPQCHAIPNVRTHAKLLVPSIGHTHAPPPLVLPQARRPDGSEVALKALSLRSLRDWKQLELFEREAKTLESLSHPGIPRYVDYFEEDDPNDRAFVLVQVRAWLSRVCGFVRGLCGICVMRSTGVLAYCDDGCCF